MKNTYYRRYFRQHFIRVFLLVGMFSFGQTYPETTDNSIEKNRPPNIVFLIADDWSYPHAGVYGDKVVRTPTFDFLAKEGALFTNAYCAAPSCSPSRASILTSRYPHQLESAGNLWSVFPDKFKNWVSILEDAGYHTGKSRKGWGPGDYQKGGYTNNPAGKDYLDFDTFLKDRKQGQPFFYWFGSQDPHRVYETNSGVKTGMDSDQIVVPDFLPNTDCVRNDIMDYFYEVERFDRESGNIIRRLKDAGVFNNTIIVMTSDNGMPFPRAKANLYDYGTRMPLAIYWKNGIAEPIQIKNFVNLIDLGSTFLEAAGQEIPKEFEGKSLLGLMKENQKSDWKREQVFLERERHANVRKGNLSYPSRAIRTKDFLFIWNFEPSRWPAGSPQVHQSVGQYGDIDNSITKFLMMDMQDGSPGVDYFHLAFAKRPSEELYDVINDPYNMHNLADEADYGETKNALKKQLQIWMEDTGDLRASLPKTTYWDEVLYTPNYQMQNFDLQEEIESYHYLKPSGSKWVEFNCEQP